MNKEDERQAPTVGNDSAGGTTSRDLSESALGFREPLGDDAMQQLRRYQVLTVPPSARRALMGAPLPGIAPDLLNDTLPPHRAVEHVEHVESEGSLELDTPAVPPTRQHRWRGFVAITLLFMVALVIVGWVKHSQGPESRPAPTVPSVPPRSASAPEPPSPSIVTEAPSRSVEVGPAPPRLSEEQPSARKLAIGLAATPTRLPSATPPAPPRSASSADVAPVSSSPAAPSPVPQTSVGKGFRLGSR